MLEKPLLHRVEVAIAVVTDRLGALATYLVDLAFSAERIEQKHRVFCEPGASDVVLGRVEFCDD